jgi:AraC family transcriptional regulator
MRSKRRIPRLVSSSKYKDYVPGQLLLNSESKNWRGLACNAFSLPTFLPEGPAPGIPDITLGLMYSGNIDGEYSINQSRWIHGEVPVNNLVLMPAHHEINWRWLPLVENPTPLKLACAYLSSDLIKKIAIETLDIEPGNIEMPTHVGANDPFVAQLLLAVKDELEKDNPLGPLYAETAAQMLALHLLSKHCTINHTIPEYRGRLSKNSLSTVLDYIHTNIHREISLESLSLLAGLSSYHFLRLFKKSTGETPLQYIIRCRMEKAKQLLAQTDLAIIEIALDVGYDSLAHFINLFKRHTGVTPSAYRKML